MISLKSEKFLIWSPHCSFPIVQWVCNSILAFKYMSKKINLSLKLNVPSIYVTWKPVCENVLKMATFQSQYLYFMIPTSHMSHQRRKKAPFTIQKVVQITNLIWSVVFFTCLHEREMCRWHPSPLPSARIWLGKSHCWW